MAKPKIVRGSYVTLMLGDGATPEVFTPICGITTKNFTDQVNVDDEFVMDCDDPEAVPDRYVNPTGRQQDISGSGLVSRDNLEDIQAALGALKNWRWVLGEPSTDEVFKGYYGGEAMLTQLTLGAEGKAFVSVELTIASNGRMAWTTTPPTP